MAPGASLLSIRVADDNGSSDTFTLAQGILNAVQAGASIINISLGSYGDSPVLSDAVQYALSKGRSSSPPQAMNNWPSSPIPPPTRE